MVYCDSQFVKAHSLAVCSEIGVDAALNIACFPQRHFCVVKPNLSPRGDPPHFKVSSHLIVPGRQVSIYMVFMPPGTIVPMGAYCFYCVRMYVCMYVCPSSVKVFG